MNTFPLPTIEFCQRLFQGGTLLAQAYGSSKGEESAAVNEWLQGADHIARTEAPGTAPPFDLPAAQWGLSVLAWSVHLLVDRANVMTALPDALAKGEPNGASACHHWSVDLSLRYLTDVFLRAQAAASEDALVLELMNICSRWPLAGVGAQKNWNAERGQVIIDDACLRGVLLDRIILRNDKILAEDPTLKRYIQVHRPPTR